MRNIVRNIIAGGMPAVVGSGLGVIWLQHELHYWFRPSMIETLSGLGAVGLLGIWAKSRSGNRQVQDAPPVQQHAGTYAAPQGLPQGHGQQYARFNTQQQRVN